MNRRLMAAAAGLGLVASSVASAAAPMRGAMAQVRTGTPAVVVELDARVVHVEIRGYAFHPARVVVSPGTRIVWQNRDVDPHTVVSPAGGFSSPAIVTGARFAVVVRKPGVYPYLCTIHPFMHGVVVVRG